MGWCGWCRVVWGSVCGVDWCGAVCVVWVGVGWCRAVWVGMGGVGIYRKILPAGMISNTVHSEIFEGHVFERLRLSVYG